MNGFRRQATRDSTREGEANRRYLAKCRIGLDRGLTTYRKLRKDRFERAKRGADEKEIYGRGGELLGSPEPRRPAASGTKGVRPWAQEIDAADVSACRGSFRPEALSWAGRGSGGGRARRHDRRAW